MEELVCSLLWRLDLCRWDVLEMVVWSRDMFRVGENVWFGRREEESTVSTDESIMRAQPLTLNHQVSEATSGIPMRGGVRYELKPAVHFKSAGSDNLQTVSTTRDTRVRTGRQQNNAR